MLIKIAAIIVHRRKLLVVRKRSNPSHYILPGGKPKPGEAPREALARELMEELGVKPTSFYFFGLYSTAAIFEESALRVHLYETDIAGDPSPASEIDDLQWVGPDFAQRGYSLGSVIEKFVIPDLAERGVF